MLTSISLDSFLNDSYLTSGIFTIYVGPARKEITVHKDLLCKKVAYFAKVFDGSFAEATSKEVHLRGPADEPAAYMLLSIWLYRGSLPPISETKLPAIDDPRFADMPANETAYHNLYYLAEMWFANNLKNAVIDTLMSWHRKSKESIHVAYIVRGYENTYGTSKLRKYLAESAAFDIQSRDAEIIQELRALDAHLTIDISLDILHVFKEGCKGLKLVNPRHRSRSQFHDGLAAPGTD